MSLSLPATLRFVSGLALSSLALSGITMQANASSHREAPNITRYPTLDSSDFYVFSSYESGRENYVTFIANYVPLQDSYGGPNYFALDPAAKYNIHIDADGDAIEDYTFQFDFEQALPNNNEGTLLTIGTGDDAREVAIPLKNSGPISAQSNAALNFTETYTLDLITGDLASGTSAAVTTNNSATFTKPHDYIGEKSFGDAASYQAYADQYVYDIAIPNCNGAGKVFVGQRKDSFAVNLGETFDLVNYVPIEGDSAPSAGDGNGFPSGITQNTANDDLLDKNVTSIALEIPKSCLTGSGNGVIGAWTTAQVPQVRIQNPEATFDKPEVNGGALTQISRLGNPLVNELVIGLPDKDRFSTSHPSADAQFADYVTNPTLPALLNVLFLDGVNQLAGTSFTNLAPTNIPRTDLAAAFLTGFAGVNQQSDVTASEMIRLNTGVAAVEAASQNNLGVAAGDLAGFPNGRRPGDDVVDIALRVVMGALCYDVPIPTETDPTRNLGFCEPEDAEVGNQPFTDGAPISASDFDTSFPYVRTPLAGSPQ